VIGSAFSTLRIGVSRGVFTNEAGMGTAGIAHSAARVNHPVEQGLMGIIEVFLDTIVICTMTALVILCSNISIPYGEDAGVLLTIQAFSSVYGSWIILPLNFAICCFAIATLLGWGLYGIRCAEFLFGKKAWKPFAILQAITVVFGAILKTSTVWQLSELVNGLMVIPNLVALAVLSPNLFIITKEYFKQTGRLSAVGGTYENFNQCQQMRTFSHEKISSFGPESKKQRKKNLPS
jgi:AGCS family alanine or glycine:cation symporter